MGHTVYMHKLRDKGIRISNKDLLNYSFFLVLYSKNFFLLKLLRNFRIGQLKNFKNFFILKIFN